jgi:hypothetical protein
VIQYTKPRILNTVGRLLSDENRMVDAVAHIGERDRSPSLDLCPMSGFGLYNWIDAAIAA